MSPNVSGAIYGQVLVTSVVAAYSEDETIGPGDIFWGVLVTMLVFWLAHVYARGMALRMDRRESLRLREVRVIAQHEWPLMQAAVPSMLALGLGAAGAFDRQTAVSLAIALGIVALFAWGFVIARRSRLGWPATIAAVALSGGLGLALVGLKVWVD